jgi:hypothetical protein
MQLAVRLPLAPPTEATRNLVARAMAAYEASEAV